MSTPEPVARTITVQWPVKARGPAVPPHPIEPFHTGGSWTPGQNSWASYWLAAANDNDQAALASSRGTGFWQHWRSRLQHTPALHLVASHGRHPEVVPFLIAEGALGKDPCPIAGPLLHRVIRQPCERSLSWFTALLATGAAEHALDKEGRTLLQRALRHGRFELCQALHARGHALPDVPDVALLPLRRFTGAERAMKLLTWLREQGVMASPDIEFYPRAILAGVPSTALSWLEDWGWALPAKVNTLPAGMLHGMGDTVGWVEVLASRGVEIQPLLEQARSSAKGKLRSWRRGEEEQYMQAAHRGHRAFLMSTQPTDLPPARSARL